MLVLLLGSRGQRCLMILARLRVSCGIDGRDDSLHIPAMPMSDTINHRMPFGKAEYGFEVPVDMARDIGGREVSPPAVSTLAGCPTVPSGSASVGMTSLPCRLDVEDSFDRVRAGFSTRCGSSFPDESFTEREGGEFMGRSGGCPEAIYDMAANLVFRASVQFKVPVDRWRRQVKVSLRGLCSTLMSTDPIFHTFYL